MQMQTPILTAACILLVSSSMAVAQVPPTLDHVPSTVLNNGDCSPTEATPRRGTISPQDEKTERNQEPLSDRLAKFNGVLCPPKDIDPQMRLSAPNVGKTPVIPPPGSPGGDLSVEPK
jgi:hypothetical protein